MNGVGITITTWESSADYLKKKIEWILDMMEKEHLHCHTHSQRNAYQAVIRHELEIMRDEIARHELPGDRPLSAVDTIPF